MNSLLSAEEQSLLDLFRNYLMTPGKMLCLNASDLDAFKMPLTQLSGKGLLVKENSKGGYSLTESGFSAMRGAEPSGN